MKFGPVIQEMSFKESVYGRTGGRTADDGLRPITIVHLEPSAQVSLNELQGQKKYTVI